MMNEKKKELDYFIYEKINQVPEKIFQDKDCKDSKNVARFFVNDNL